MAAQETERYKAKYLERLRHILRKAPADIREDVIHEVETHIDDKWQSLGGDPQALQVVLQRLGPPEDYGKDLAMQLMLMRGRQQRSVRLVTLAALFWISSSLIGAATILFSTLLLGFAIGMVYTAAERIRGNSFGLIDSTDFQFLTIHVDRFYFPPESWHPSFIAAAGLIPALVAAAGIYWFFSKWARSRLANHWFSIIVNGGAMHLNRRWERRTLLTMITFAGLGLSICMFFSLISNMVPVGQPGSLELPADFFRTPLTLLAFLGLLIFLASPILSLLVSARSSGGNNN